MSLIAAGMATTSMSAAAVRGGGDDLAGSRPGPCVAVFPHRDRLLSNE
ncbi:hypothetical protein GFS60_07746 (plasmid) [Rhodococcus sp. WAY2]|nr:hypothetical protein GFS60_07746 [Rhodococcus sp. WAY2]